VVTHFDNASATELAGFVAIYLKGTPDQAFIVMTKG
jgi:hypothetical protein